MKKISDERCPVRKTLGLLGGKWTLLILFQLSDESRRFGELRRSIPGISEKVLIQKLKFLNENGFVLKKQFPEIPPKVEYRLSALGKKTIPFIHTIAEFGSENL